MRAWIKCRVENAAAYAGGGGAIANGGACDATRLGGTLLADARRRNQTPFYAFARST